MKPRNEYKNRIEKDGQKGTRNLPIDGPAELSQFLKCRRALLVSECDRRTEGKECLGRDTVEVLHMVAETRRSDQ